MCCILLSLSHPDFALVLASNRDEVVSRPTRHSAWHDFEEDADTADARSPSPDEEYCSSSGIADSSLGTQHSKFRQRRILSGVDASPQGGGTWLGITRQGQFAALTNVSYDAHFDPAKRYKSRGALLRQWLLTSSSSEEEEEREGSNSAGKFIEEQVKRHAEQYPGFHLFVGTTKVVESNKEDRSIREASVSLSHACNREAGGAEGFVVEALRPDGSDTRREKSIVLTCPPPPPNEDGISSSSSSSRSCAFSNEAGLASAQGTEWGKISLGQQLLDAALDNFDAEKENDGEVVDEDEPAEEADRKRREDNLAEHLFSILRTSSDPAPHTDQDRKNSILIPPLPMGPQGKYFATRTSTVLLIRRRGDKAGQAPLARWWERDVYQQEKPEQAPSLLAPQEAKQQQRYFDWVLE